MRPTLHFFDKRKLLEIQRIGVSTLQWGTCFDVAVLGFCVSTLFVSTDSSCVCANPLISW